MFEKFRKSLSKIIYTARNSMSLPEQFFRYGSNGGKTMYADWSQVMMSDKDHYTGYSYAAIRNRANAVARIAEEFLKTEAPQKDFEHPYTSLIKESTLFSENMFWSAISTYLDLEGVYYLMVLRNFDETANRFGNPLKFKMLNPYNIRRVLNKETLEVAGYIENRKGFQREIPPSMIIEIRDLNPFDQDENFAMTDAARESSFTLKSAGDYTRHVLRNNIDAPGIISTDVVLPEELFKNFVARMKDHTKGEPVFGNGASAVKWTPMNIDLSKSALSDINEVSRDTLFAVSGMSKTMMGIEQSGTTRETSNVQKDLFIENQVVPRVNVIIDALNLDYKNRYPVDYKKNQATLALENPIDSDQETEAKKANIKTVHFDLFQEMVDLGYDVAIASKYVEGEIELDEIGEPTNDPKPPPALPSPTNPTPMPMDTPSKKMPKKKPPTDMLMDMTGKKKKMNELEPDHIEETSKTVIQDQESMLQNTIVNVDGQLAVAAINRIPKLVKNGIKKNDITSEDQLITEREKKKVENELILVLTAFYGIVGAIQGNETIKDRIAKFGGEGKYVLDKTAKEGIKKMAKKVAESHVDTVSTDLYQIAREAALKGKSQLEIIGELKGKYSHDVTENRARTIARTETNRAFTMAQHDADREFIKDNDLQGRAYKQYHTRSGNPCAFCQELEDEGPIPFDEPFVKKGGKVTAKVDGEEVTFDVNFESVEAGNLHPNCSCDYTLTIEPE